VTAEPCVELKLDRDLKANKRNLLLIIGQQEKLRGRISRKFISLVDAAETKKQKQQSHSGAQCHGEGEFERINQTQLNYLEP
jgi:hypothetical protein